MTKVDSRRRCRLTKNRLFVLAGGCLSAKLVGSWDSLQRLLCLLAAVLVVYVVGLLIRASLQLLLPLISVAPLSIFVIALKLAILAVFF